MRQGDERIVSEEVIVILHLGSFAATTTIPQSFNAPSEGFPRASLRPSLIVMTQTQPTLRTTFGCYPRFVWCSSFVVLSPRCDRREMTTAISFVSTAMANTIKPLGRTIFNKTKLRDNHRRDGTPTAIIYCE